MKLTEKETKKYKKKFIEKYEQKYGELFVDGEYGRIMRIIEKAMKAELKKLSDIDVMERKHKIAFTKNVMEYVDKNHNKGRLTEEKYMSLTEDERDKWIHFGNEPVFFSEKEIEDRVEELVLDCNFDCEEGECEELFVMARESFNDVCEGYSINGILYIESWGEFEEDLNINFNLRIEKRFG